MLTEAQVLTIVLASLPTMLVVAAGILTAFGCGSRLLDYPYTASVFLQPNCV